MNTFCQRETFAELWDFENLGGFVFIYELTKYKFLILESGGSFSTLVTK